MVLKIKDSVAKVGIFSRNMLSVYDKTFKIVLRKSDSSFKLLDIVYGTISFLFMSTMCAVCLIACAKCFGKRGANWDGEEDWDDDRRRIARMRQLMR